MQRTIRHLEELSEAERHAIRRMSYMSGMIRSLLLRADRQTCFCLTRQGEQIISWVGIYSPRSLLMGWTAIGFRSRGIATRATEMLLSHLNMRRVCVMDARMARVARKAGCAIDYQPWWDEAAIRGYNVKALWRTVSVSKT